MPFDVSADHCCVQTHGRRKIPDAPDAVFFEIDVTNKLKLLSESLARECLELGDGICHKDVWWYLYLYVDVIFVNIAYLYPERRILLNHLEKALLEFREYIVFEYFSSSLCAPDDMVLMQIR